MKSYVLPALTVGLLTAGVSSAQAVTIKFDDFSQNFATGGSGPLTSVVPAPPSTTLGPTLSGTVNYTLGGNAIQRDASVQAIRDGDWTEDNKSELRNNSFTQTARFDNNEFTIGTAIIKYTFTGGPIDLTSGGLNNGLRLKYTNNSTNLGILITATDSLTNTFSVAGAVGFQGSFTNYDLLFSQFTGVDFSSISSVEYQFNQNVADGDTNINFVAATAVPEPLTILGTLLAGGIGVVMKKKKSSEIQE